MRKFRHVLFVALKITGLMTVRDDRLPTRQDVEKRSEMRSDTKKHHTFKLLTWNHISKTYISL